MMMSRLRLLSLLLWSVLTATAQSDFRTPWISCSSLDAGQHAWFRETVVLDEQPAQALLQVTTGGYVQVYVNERNVSTAVRLPYRLDATDDAPMAVVEDITRFLGAGRNVIAIHYAPLSLQASQRHQVAASLWGCYRNGSPFSLSTDDDWLCRPATSRLNNRGDETIDGRQQGPKWCGSDLDVACWLPVESHPEAFGEDDYEEPEDYSPADHMALIVKPAHVIPTHDGLSCVFNQGFEGWIRITLRKAKAGERIRIDDTEYICSGQFDEQACPRFVIRPHRIVHISGDSHFQPSQVANIEGIAVSPRWNAGF